MDNPLVSILCPVFNEEAYIAQMIESCLAQTYKEWELVVVDDGSTDDTRLIVDNYSSRDARVRMYSLEHKGLTSALNTAFEKSCGRIIVNCGGDDYMPEDSLQNRVSAFQRYDLESRVACFAHVRMFWDDDSRKPVIIPRGRQGSSSSPGYAMTRPLGEVAFPIPSQLVADDPWVGEVLRSAADHVVHIAGVSVNYRIHPGNTNPRHLSFNDMSDSLFTHAQAIANILETDRFELSQEDRKKYAAQWVAEQRRHQQRPLQVLFTRNLAVADRLALTAAASPTLTRFRTLFYGSLSGWRRR